MRHVLAVALASSGLHAWTCSCESVRLRAPDSDIYDLPFFQKSIQLTDMMLIGSICLNLLFTIMICNICCCCSCFRCCRCCVIKRKSDRTREGAAVDEVRVLVEEDDGKQQEKKRDQEERHEEVTEMEREEKKKKEEEEGYDVSQNLPTENPIYATVDRRNRSKYLDVETGIEVTPGTMDRFFTQDREIPAPIASSETS